MVLQEWFNDNMPHEDLIYGGAMRKQVTWVRDTLAPMMFRSCVHLNPDFGTWKTRDYYLVVKSTHTSKSVTLPVYKFLMGDFTIEIRGNFHDWCVCIKGLDTKIIERTGQNSHNYGFPEYMKERLTYGYYEGINVDEDNDQFFCVQSREELYAMMWWLLNNI